MRLILAVAMLAATALSAVPTRAEVSAASEGGFVVSGELTLLNADPGDVWPVLVAPGQWWSDAHSWSGSAANMTLDPVAGGCFCEAIPGQQPGSVEHMRVVQVRPEALLVMRGGLGPLQGEALTGVLAIRLEPVTAVSAQSADAANGTKLVWTYVVGGYARFPLVDVAPAVDGVLREQMQRLAARMQGGA